MRSSIAFTLLFLFQSLCAQITVSGSIGLAEDYCTGPDPTLDCINVPNGMDLLEYLPGIDSLILVTYRFTNGSAQTITQITISDSERGVIIPVTTVNIAPGQTVTANRIYPAELLPAVKISTVTAVFENAGGNSGSTNNQYELVIAGPEISTEFGVGRKADLCPDVAPANCPIQIGTNSVTVGVRDSFVFRLNWTNEGLAFLDHHEVVDQDGQTLSSTGFNLNPGQTLALALTLISPDLPGTYNYSLTLTCLDVAGNSVSATHNYTVIVEGPQIITEFGVGRKADLCPDVVPANCPIQIGTNSVTVGVRDSFVFRLNWTNEGLAFLDQHEVVDQDGQTLSSTGFNLNPGQTLALALTLISPDLPGTYPYSLTLTCLDVAGNSVSATHNYTVIVVGPQIITEFGVGRKADLCPNVVPAGCPIVFGTNTVTVGVRDSFVFRLNWTNEGLAFLDHHEVVDQDGQTLSSTGFNLNPGQTLALPLTLISPDLPGTYPYSLTLTCLDVAGNSVSATHNYTVIVVGPQIITEFGVGRKADLCPDVVPANCPIVFGTNTVTVGVRDSFVFRLNWTNDGLAFLDQHEVVDQDGQTLSSTGFNLNPGQTLALPLTLISPDLPGTYPYSLTLTCLDVAGNSVSATYNYTVIVDCAVADLVPPVALCRDLSYTIFGSQTINLTPADVNNNSFDECDILAGAIIDLNTFGCGEEGDNTVTLTVVDESGNTASCTSVVSIEVETEVIEGIPNQCNSITESVAGTGFSWVDLRNPGGKIIGQVDIRNNTGLEDIFAQVHTLPNLTSVTGNGFPVLSKQITLDFLDAGGQFVQPSGPVRLRLYYSAAEIAALLAAEPGSDLNTLTLVKTDNSCGATYTANNPQIMNTNLGTFGCTGEDYYLQFFTNSFSTFTLFPSGAVLPVELSRFEATAKQDKTALLSWTTQTEQNNDYFEVQHGTDGRSFSTIATVSGYGFSTTPIDYQLQHDQPATGENYYRLKQVDFDGTTTLSEIRIAYFTQRAEPTQWTIFPNPSSEWIMLNEIIGSENYEIFDQSGRLLITAPAVAGQRINLATLKSGMYWLRYGGQLKAFQKL